jgi:hypothetical protein
VRGGAPLPGAEAAERGVAMREIGSEEVLLASTTKARGDCRPMTDRTTRRHGEGTKGSHHQRNGGQAMLEGRIVLLIELVGSSCPASAPREWFSFSES